MLHPSCPYSIKKIMTNLSKIDFARQEQATDNFMILVTSPKMS